MRQFVWKALGVLGLLLLIGSSSFAASVEELSRQIEVIESRLSSVESALEASDCTLVYKFVANRFNRCDQGAFVRAVRDVGANAKLLECGRYELRCSSHGD